MLKSSIKVSVITPSYLGSWDHSCTSGMVSLTPTVRAVSEWRPLPLPFCLSLNEFEGYRIFRVQPPSPNRTGYVNPVALKGIEQLKEMDGCLGGVLPDFSTILDVYSICWSSYWKRHVTKVQIFELWPRHSSRAAGLQIAKRQNRPPRHMNHIQCEHNLSHKFVCVCKIKMRYSTRGSWSTWNIKVVDISTFKAHWAKMFVHFFWVCRNGHLNNT